MGSCNFILLFLNVSYNRGLLDYCIKNNILKVFLNERRTEVLDMTAVDYTYERRMILNYNEGKEEGIKDGIARGERKLLLDKISKKLSKGKSISQIADELEESEDAIKDLVKEVEK